MTEEIKILLIAAVVAAFIIGFILGKLIPNKKKTKASQKELDDYKQSVSEHFSQTANLIDNLTDSYKAVFDHLGDSAKNLLNKEQIDNLLASRQHKITTLNYLSEKKEDALEENKEKENVSTEIEDENIDKKDNQDNVLPKNETIDEANPKLHKKSTLSD